MNAKCKVEVAGPIEAGPIETEVMARHGHGTFVGDIIAAIRCSARCMDKQEVRLAGLQAKLETLAMQLKMWDTRIGDLERAERIE